MRKWDLKCNCRIEDYRLVLTHMNTTGETFSVLLYLQLCLPLRIHCFFIKIRTKFESFGYQESGEDMFSYTVN